MKKSYADYVNHILRFYTRNIHKSKFRSEADKLNFRAAERVFAGLDDMQRMLLCEIYTRSDTIYGNVDDVSKIYGIEQKSIWRLINQVSDRIARERILI